MSPSTISLSNHKKPISLALSRSAWWLVPAVYAVSAFAFITDLQRANTLAYGIIYTPLIVTAVFHKHRSGLWILTGAACVMVVVGAFLPVFDSDFPDMIGNRILSILAILVTAAFVHYGRDVQERLAGETRRAEAAERIKTDVLTNLSQEIRTPLHSMVGMLALTMVDSKPDQRELLSRVNSDSRHLLATIDNLIDLLQVETRQWLRDKINIATVAREACEAASIAARERQIAVALDVDTGAEDALAIGDRWAARRMFENILANAVRMTPAGGAVSVSVDRDTETVSVSVRDMGPGLPAEFEQQFNQDPPPNSGQSLPASGGIALALSSHLARLMNGRVIARNNHGSGATVTLALPAA